MWNRSWTKKELDYVAKHYGKKKPSDISKHLNRTETAVHQKAHALGKIGSKTTNGWSEKEIDDLIELYPITPTDLLTKLFDRTLKAIQQKAHEYGLRKEKEARKKRVMPKPQNSWTEEEEAILRRDFPIMASHKVPVNRTTAAIRSYAKKLGLKKTPRYIQKCRYRYAMLASQGRV